MTQSFIHSFMHYALQVQEENTIQFSPVSQSCPTLHTPMDHSTRHPCPSPALGVYSNSCPLSWWCPPTISFSVVPFSSSLQSFPASGGQSIGASASASVFIIMNIQDWFPLGLTGLISLQTKGLSRVFSNTTVQKSSILWHSAFFIVRLSHPYMTTEKTIALTIWTFVDKVMSLPF